MPAACRPAGPHFVDIGKTWDLYSQLHWDRNIAAVANCTVVEVHWGPQSAVVQYFLMLCSDSKCLLNKQPVWDFQNPKDLA